MNSTREIMPHPRLLILLVLLLLGVPQPAWSQVTNWTASPPTVGDWFNSGNWSSGVPTLSKIGVIDNGGTASISSSVAQADGLRLGSSASGNLIQTGGSLQIDDNGLVLGTFAGASGTYTLSNGTLTVFRQFSLGSLGQGQFDQSGGQVTLSDEFMKVGDAAGSSGTYNLSGGTFTTVLDLTLGNAGQGNFVQTGGTSQIKTLRISEGTLGHGQYDLQAGGLTTTSTLVGGLGDAEFFHSGGNHQTTSLRIGGYGGTSGPQVGQYEMDGAAAVLTAGSEIVGTFGNGTFTQSAGTHTVNSFLWVGTGGTGKTGTFNLSGGSLETNEEQVGIHGTAVFNQSGGTHTVHETLYVGFGSDLTTEDGTFNLSGGSLEVEGDEYVAYGAGHGGFGTFHQTGGTHSVTGDLILGRDSSSAIALYDIVDGSLSVGGDLIVGLDLLPQKRFRVIGGLGDIDVAGNFAMGPFNTPATTPTLEAIIDPTGLSPLEIDGTASLRGRLSVDLLGSYLPSLGQQFVVLTAGGGVNGSLTLTGPDASAFQMLTLPHSVVLVSLVPEPTSLAMAIGGFIGAVIVCRPPAHAS